MMKKVEQGIEDLTKIHDEIETKFNSGIVHGFSKECPSYFLSRVLQNMLLCSTDQI